MSDDAPQPLRVSDWNRPTTGPREPSPAPSAPEPRPAPASSGSAEENPEAASAGLPIDPFRLLGGLWKRRLILLIAPVAGVLLGLSAGIFLAKSRTQVTVQLIKHTIPSTIRASEVGEPFKPKELSTGTLVGAAASENVLDRVAAKATPPVTASQLRGGIEVKEQKNTDFVFLTLSGAFTSEQIVDLANLWAREVVQYSRELQTQESHEMRQFLQSQVESNQVELRKLNDEILEFSRRENLVDANKEIDSYLRSFGELDLRYETARINLQTIDFKIDGVLAELRRQSPLTEKLTTAKNELQELRSKYAAQNPLVLEKQETIQSLEQQIQTAGEKQADPSSYAGTFLGNTLYLDLLKLQNEKKSLLRERDELERLRNNARTKLDSIPEKAAAFAQLGQRKQSFEIASNLLFSRLREAQMFEENAPGYYRVFVAASSDFVIRKGRSSKIIIFTVAGGVVFLLLGLSVALVLELLDPVLRTGPEAAKALGLPLLDTVPARNPEPELGPEIWTRWLTAQPDSSRPRVIWSPCLSEPNTLFWDLMLERASVLLPNLRLIHAGPASLLPKSKGGLVVECLDTDSLSIEQARQWGQELAEECRRGRTVWLHLTGPVREPMTTLARCGTPPLLLVPLNKEDSAFWKSQGELLATSLRNAAGCVATGEIPWNER